MIESRFIELMAKHMGKSATPEEIKELEEFFIHFPEYRKMQNFTDVLTTEEKQSDTLMTKDLDQNLDKIWKEIKREESIVAPVEEAKIRPLSFLKWAAAVLLMGILAAVFFLAQKPDPLDRLALSGMQNIYVPFGKIRELQLPDGTRVKLNAGSSFSYPKVFSTKNRLVTLKGEGFFEVARDANRPFLVHTDKVMIKVLGTAFNVKAYSTDKKIEATLLSGKIQVGLNDKPEKNIVMKPNEKLTLINKGAATEYELEELPDLHKDEVAEIAWLSNKLVFTNERFDEVSTQIERRFDVKIVFENEALKKERISGVFKDESLEQALSFIKMTTSFKYRRDGGVIFLSLR
ncbi:FecR family protein [Pedobacter caeni]|uniref:FecR family protein n=1 Tax=Pedobacter caeni TaxID=288992 RepID=A0A1M5A079_9SPHI|nr:FecR domain-containing protein [Pedobacter caeni]SHF23507.1 FecR family protein [Pedobacter caeni]